MITKDMVRAILDRVLDDWADENYPKDVETTNEADLLIVSMMGFLVSFPDTKTETIRHMRRGIVKFLGAMDEELRNRERKAS